MTKKELTRLALKELRNAYVREYEQYTKEASQKLLANDGEGYLYARTCSETAKERLDLLTEMLNK